MDERGIKMSENPHYFIAIPIPFKMQTKLRLWQDFVKERLRYKHWVHPEDFHITLKFLGPVSSGIRSVINELTILERLPAFTLTIGNIGFFGQRSRPRVLWVHVEQTRHLSSLQKLVEKQMVHLGFAKEKRSFRPHITLAKRWIGHSDQTAVNDIQDHFQQLHTLLAVNEIMLYRIFPKQTPKYKVVHRFKLQEER